MTPPSRKRSWPIGEAAPQGRARLVARSVWLLLGAASLALLALARSLTPAPNGLGTHVALGLSPCSFLLHVGLPCPTCGLTSAFARLARFELTLALRAHPLGLPLFALTCCLLLASPWLTWRATSPAQLAERLRADRWALALVVALLVTWVARLLGQVVA